MPGFRALLLLLLCLAGLAPVYSAEPMQTRIFRVPPSSFEIPFPVGTPLMDKRDVFKSAGIPFPEGATADVDPVANLLITTNTAASLELTRALVEDTIRPPKQSIAFLVTVIEGPGGLIRQANAATARANDATQELTFLLSQAKNAGSKVRVVGDCFLETRDGSRATTSAVREHTTTKSLKLDAQSRPSVEQEMVKAGLLLQLDPTLRSDGRTVGCTLELTLHPAPPLLRQIRATDPLTGSPAEFPASELPSALFTTQFHTTSGQTKLIGVTKPKGTPKENEDVLWAAFVTTTLRPRAEPALPSAPALIGDAAPDPTSLETALMKVPDGLLETAAEEPLLLHRWPEEEGITSVKGAPFRLQTLLEREGITFGKGAQVSQTGGVLRITNTPLNIARMSVLVGRCLQSMPKSAAYTAHTFEAPAALVRDLARQTLAASVDDAAMLAAVQAAEAKGQATCVDFIFLAGRPNDLSTWQTGHDHRHLSGLRTDAKGRPALDFDTRFVGTDIRTETNTDYDHTLETRINHEIHPAAPETRRDSFLDPASKQRFDMPVTDFYVAGTVHSMGLPTGGTKLVALHAPVGRAVADKLWVSFLRCDVVPLISPPSPLPPAKKEAPPAEDPKAWDTREYRVPPEFLSMSGKPSGGPRMTARHILESQGITFPDGATAVYNPAASIMVVRNTRGNLALVKEYVDTLRALPPAEIIITAQVLQGPGPRLRPLAATLATQGDHRAALDELLAAVKEGTIQAVDTARLQTRSGTQTKTTQATGHPALTGVSLSDKGATVFDHENHPVGFIIQAEPTIGADGSTVELTLESEFHTAAPQEHAEHVIAPGGRRLEFPLTDYHFTKFSTLLSILPGHARLVSAWKPTGRPEFEKEDVLQVMFITCDVLRGEAAK